MPLEQPKAEMLAYIAGFFDGEGCVNFTQSGQYKTWVIRVMIRNTNLAIIQYIQSTFGGRIETKKQSGRSKASYFWRLDWDAAIAFLEMIEPWVRIKQDQILVARLWDVARNRGNVRPDDDYREMVTLLVGQLQWLNRKGPRVETDKEPMAQVKFSVPIDQILAEVGTCH